MTLANRKSEEIRRRKEKLLERFNARIAEAERVEASRQRKDDARYRIILGACLLADLQNNPDLAVLLEESLKRTASPRDAEYLRDKGWNI